jgi:hypothetical protein
VWKAGHFSSQNVRVVEVALWLTVCVFSPWSRETAFNEKESRHKEVQ